MKTKSEIGEKNGLRGLKIVEGTLRRSRDFRFIGNRIEQKGGVSWKNHECSREKNVLNYSDLRKQRVKTNSWGCK